jgi:hypothetical protein
LRSNGGHRGTNNGQPKHPGGSLEELMKGNYKGNNFNLDKSSKYQALIAHLQRSGGGGR